MLSVLRILFEEIESWNGPAKALFNAPMDPMRARIQQNKLKCISVFDLVESSRLWLGYCPEGLFVRLRPCTMVVITTHK